MPKGVIGCYVCGVRDEPTRVQVWMRAYTDEKDAAGNRRQVSVDSRVRSFCPLHGEDAYLTAMAALEREMPAYHGCAQCGKVCAFRIQVIMTPAGQPIAASMSGGFCLDHAEAAFEKACAPLAGEYHHTGQGTPGVVGFGR